MPTKTAKPQTLWSSNWSMLSDLLRFLSAACRSKISFNNGFRKRKRSSDSTASGW